MVAFIILLSTFLSIAFTWLVAFGVIVYSKGGWAFLKALSWPDFLAYWIALLLPILVILTAFAFIYLSLEMKKNQLFFKDWLKALKGEMPEVPAFLLQKKEIPEELKKEPDMEEQKIVKISKNEPLDKYKDLDSDENTLYQFTDDE